MFQEVLQKVLQNQNLTELEAEMAMDAMMDGNATHAQMGALLAAFNMKGTTVEEIAGCARAMRRKGVPVQSQGMVVDTCGTGGDCKHTFNISTTAALVAAGAGLTVAKHGNRSVSSKCGSADVLEELGVSIMLSPESAAQCLREVGISFLFAPSFHQAMKNVMAPRRELGIRTIFNILGPLTNPAGAPSQLLGVFRPELTELLAGALLRLGTQKALVVHGLDGMDEITVCGKTKITEINGQSMKTYYIEPEQFGFTTVSPGALTGGDAKQNAVTVMQVLQGEPGPKREVVLLNAGAALMAGNMAGSLEEGICLATASINSGSALGKMYQLREFTCREVLLC